MRRCPVQARHVAGFTLIEAAVVLVVIGLILGVVLQGQSLIRNAEYRSFKSQINDYQSAYYAFRDRYNALPGDMTASDANQRLEDGINAGGNGNGIIDFQGGPQCSADSEESCIVWQHLRAAGLIQGNPERQGEDASPSHTYAGVFSSMFTGSAGNNRFEDKMLITGVPGDIASRLDNDLDDERPDRGRVSCNDCSGNEYPGQDEVVEVVFSL